MTLSSTPNLADVELDADPLEESTNAVVVVHLEPETLLTRYVDQSTKGDEKTLQGVLHVKGELLLACDHETFSFSS